MNIWFTSDTHFFHPGILHLGKGRPFASLEDMHEALVKNWNDRVKPGDLVYHLGDFALSKANVKDDIRKLFAQLNGEKFLVRGNHDMKNQIVQQLKWRWIGDIKYIKVDRQSIMLCHYPMLTWYHSNKGSWMLHGHCHHRFEAEDPHALRLNIGVDMCMYAPVSFEEVRAEMLRTKDVAHSSYKAQ